jgi:hypothetical protein
MKKIFIVLTIIPIYSMQDSKNEVIPNIKIVIHKASVEEKKTTLPNAIEDPRQKKLRHYTNVARQPHFFVTSPPTITNFELFTDATAPAAPRIHPIPVQVPPIRCPRLRTIVGGICAAGVSMGIITGFIYWFNYSHGY